MMRQAHANYWTPEEDAKLLQLHDEQGLSYSLIAERFPARSPEACRVRHQHLKGTRKRGPRKQRRYLGAPMGRVRRVYSKSSGLLAFEANSVAIAARDRRSDERSLMTLGEIAMGDPPLSQSALGKRLSSLSATVQAQGASLHSPSPIPTSREAPTI